MLAYLADIWLKSGAPVVPQPLSVASRARAGRALRTKKRNFILLALLNYPSVMDFWEKDLLLAQIWKNPLPLNEVGIT